MRKGVTNNPNGRPKGVPNKVTTDLRQWINNFLHDNLKQILKDWKSLDAKDRVILFEKLLKYTLPTLQATNVTANICNEKDNIENMTDEELKAKLAQLEKAIEE